jgi:hypothetical protein
MDHKIRVLDMPLRQKEVYYFVKEGERWLIDELVVTDEEIDTEKLRL